MNYCGECGFKIEGNYKFCPNCGSKVDTQSISSVKSEEANIGVIICKNCGEENQIENSECFSCGIALNGDKSKKKSSKKSELKKNFHKKTDASNRSSISKDKTLDNKKIILISAIIVVVFILALIVSGVFDTGVRTSNVQMTNQIPNSGADLANLEEINQLENKIEANPEDLESTLHLAHLQQDAGFHEKAIANYKKYLNKFPENADARVDMAICYYNLDDYALAISEMELAIKYQPKHQIAYLNLGIVNLAAKNIDASKEWFNKTIELDPNSEAGKRAQELLHSH